MFFLRFSIGNLVFSRIHCQLIQRRHSRAPFFHFPFLQMRGYSCRSLYVAEYPIHRDFLIIPQMRKKIENLLPLYQNTLPISCGPFDILHVRFISLPVFTYKSAVPKTIAFSSKGTKHKLREHKKKNN